MKSNKQSTTERISNQPTLLKSGNPFKNILTDQKFAKRFVIVNKALETIFDSTDSFSWTHFLNFKPPNKYFFSYKPEARRYSAEKWYDHCIRYSQQLDPCIKPLSLLAQNGNKKLPSLRFFIAEEKAKFLVQIKPEALIGLTLSQRQHLGKIHSSDSLLKEITTLIESTSMDTIIHGDYRMANLLFYKKFGKSLLHVIDWELCEMGPFVYDWSTLMADYIALYLHHYIETQGNPQKLKWEHIETLIRQHLFVLGGYVAKNQKTLSKNYIQWIGILLLHKSYSLADKTSYGLKISELFFQMGRRFLLEQTHVITSIFKARS